MKSDARVLSDVYWVLRLSDCKLKLNAGRSTLNKMKIKRMKGTEGLLH